jgi:hypothetical protein
MAEAPDKILEHIDAERERLSQNIDELESYVREKANVRVYYWRKPWYFVGGAAFGGMLLALIMLPNGDRRRAPRDARNVY